MYPGRQLRTVKGFDVVGDTLVWLDRARGICTWPVESEAFDFEAVVEESCTEFYDAEHAKAMFFLPVKQ